MGIAAFTTARDRLLTADRAGAPGGTVCQEIVRSFHDVHVKAIYDEAGVGNRSELVATLFANHVLDHFHESVTNLDCPDRRRSGASRHAWPPRRLELVPGWMTSGTVVGRRGRRRIVS